MKDEYIRKKDAIDLINKISNLDLKAKGGICVSLANLKKADVAQVVHAHWTDTDNYYRRWRCSACGGHTKEAHPQFCPFCGAKMDGEE